jgi:hypothetical protein
MTDRKFYRTVVHVEILSEEPIPEGTTLEKIAHEIRDGDWSGSLDMTTSNQECDGAEMARLLMDQGSATEFFQLDEGGNDFAETVDDHQRGYGPHYPHSFDS